MAFALERIAVALECLKVAFVDNGTATIDVALIDPIRIAADGDD